MPRTSGSSQRCVKFFRTASLATALVAIVLPAGAIAAPGAAIETLDAGVQPEIAVFDGEHQAELSYRLRTTDPVALRIEVVDRRSGEVVRGWTTKALDDGRYEQSWSGLTGRGEVTESGAYKFTVRAKGAATVAAVAKFEFRDHVFPIAGPHSYREGLGDFGAPRPGRIHEGKDVWAGCGTPVVAARGGVVQRRGYDDELYGNFVVIDGRKTETDYFYVHLLQTAAPKEGDRVRSGETIGQVGATGNARSVGCMLHLELWPEGFRKGSPIDPEPLLRAWDA